MLKNNLNTGSTNFKLVNGGTKRLLNFLKECRRARGLPLWFSLATHGTHAYTDAVEQTLLVAREAATRISNHPHLELVVDQSLSICVFRRIGWEPTDYKQWSDDQLERG